MGNFGNALASHATEQRTSAEVSPTNAKTRTRNFNKILIIYSQRQLRSFTS